MSKHVIKFEFDDGKELENPILWCGRKASINEWYFQDAQHAALSAGTSIITPCKNCIKAIIDELSKEL